MNKTNPANEPSDFKIKSQKTDASNTKDKTPKDNQSGTGKSATLMSALALVLSLGGLGAGYYFFQQNNMDKAELTDSINAIREENSSFGSNLSSEMAQRDELIQDTLAQSTGERQEISQRLTGLDDTLLLISSKTQWGSREWSLAEINYLVQIAADRLYFMRDAATASSALKTAISRVDLMGDSELSVLRQRLQNDIVQVNQRVDTSPLTVLESFEQTIAGFRPMPTHAETESEESPSTGSSGQLEDDLMSKIKRSLEDRYRLIEHDTELNALDRNTVTRQQFDLLLLRTEALRHALTTDNQSLFEREILSLEKWTQANVETDLQTPILAEITKLKQQALFPPLPTLEKTQSLLRALTQGVPAPAEEAPQSQTNAS